MSRSRQAREPRLEAMEDRVVLSSSGTTPTVPVLVQDARLVQQDFAAFRSTYSSDFQSVLFGASSGGSINPVANRSSFDADVATALGTLNSSIDTTISALPAASTLESTISSELLGTGGNSLQAQLAAIPTPSGPYTLSSRLFQADSVSTVTLTAAEINHQVRTSTPPSSTTTTTTGGGTTTTTTGTLTASQLGQDLKSVRSAFVTFKSAYASDVTTILYGAAPDGSINPTTSRAAFNTQVATDLTTLSDSVTSALATIPSNSSLVTEVQDAIGGSGSNTLVTALADLTTPTGVMTTSSRAFSIDSTVAINSVEAMVAGDILKAATPEVTNS